MISFFPDPRSRRNAGLLSARYEALYLSRASDPVRYVPLRVSTTRTRRSQRSAAGTGKAAFSFYCFSFSLPFLSFDRSQKSFFRDHHEQIKLVPLLPEQLQKPSPSRIRAHIAVQYYSSFSMNYGHYHCLNELLSKIPDPKKEKTTERPFPCITLIILPLR